MRLFAFGQFGEAFDEGIGRSTTTTQDVHQTFIDVCFHLCCHLVGSLTVFAEFVGQSCIGVGADEVGRVLCQLLQEGEHLVGTERAVQSNGEDVERADGGKERFQRLTAEQSACLVGDGDAEHDGKLQLPLFHHIAHGGNSRFGIQRVENGFYQEGIDATFGQCLRLFVVGVVELVVGDVSISGVVDVGRDGSSLVGWAHRTRHESRFIGCAEFVGHLPGYLRSTESHLAAQVFQMIVGLRDALCRERIGFDDVGTSEQISAVDVGDDVRAREVQHVVVSL